MRKRLSVVAVVLFTPSSLLASEAGEASTIEAHPVETPNEEPESPGPRKTGKARLAVADVVVSDGELNELVGESLSAVLAAEISARAADRYEVISRGNLRSMLKQQIDRQKLGCLTPDCFETMHELADADWLVSSTLTKLGEDWVLSLEMVDLRAAVVTSRQKVSWSGDLSGLVELVRPYVARLLDGTAAENYRGSLEILTNEEQAEVIVNSSKLGESPVPLARELPIGKHEVLITKPGYVPFESDVVVQRNEITVLQVNLVDEASLEPWYRKWWVWASIGAGVVAIAATSAAVAVSTSGEQGPQEPALVVNTGLPE